MSAPNKVTFARRRTARRGLGLAELLIAGAIVASLLAAVAVAVDASFQLYAANQVRAQTTQRARIALDRMLASVRVAEDHAPLDEELRPDFTTGLIVQDTGIVMFDEAGQIIGWRYDEDQEALLFTRGEDSHVMLRDVRAFRVTLEPMRSRTAVRTGGAHDRLRRASVLLTVGVAGGEPGIDGRAQQETFSLSSSVVPRRNVGL